MRAGFANWKTLEAPADAAAALYVGEVMHARLKPMGHRFSYRVMSLLIDLDRLTEADRQSRLFGVNRAALYSFHEADHGARDGSSLRAYAQRCAAEHGIDLTGGRVLLLCYPRLLGYTFNPLSVYFCYRAERRAGAADLRGAQHLWRDPPLRPAGETRRDQRCRRAAAAGQAVLRLALHRDGDALPFSRAAAGRARPVADSGDRPRRPPARCNLQWPSSRPRHRAVAGGRSSPCRWSP